MSPILLIASGLYGLMASGCLFAALTARRSGKPAEDVSSWAFAAGFALFLAMARWFDLENWARDSLRTALREGGGHADRLSYQQPLTAAALVAAMIILMLALWLLSRRRVRSETIYVLLCRLAMLGLISLFFIRIVSLHFIDRLLYGGGLHFNWFLEGSLVIGAGCAALLYVRKIGNRRPRRR